MDGTEVFDAELSKLPTDGWHIVDSTNLSVDETVDEVIRLLAREVRDRLPHRDSTWLCQV